MNENSTKTEYLLLFRGSRDWDKGLSPEQLQKIMDRFTGWFDRLKQEGKLKAGQPLERAGKIVSGKNGRMVSDGPFVEAKESVGGYFIVQVDDIDAAVAIAQECPVLEFGTAVEVRPIAEECPTFERIKNRLAEAAA
jgi:hypothetical protein